MERLVTLQAGANIAFALTVLGVLVAVFCVLLDYRQKQDKEPGDLVCLGRDLFNVLAAGGTLAVTLQVIVWVQIIERRTEIIEERVLPVREARAPDFGAVTDGIADIQETLAAGEGRDDDRFADLEERIRELVEPALAEPAPAEPVSLAERMEALYRAGRLDQSTDVTEDLLPILGPLDFTQDMILVFDGPGYTILQCGDRVGPPNETRIGAQAGYTCRANPARPPVE